MSELRFPLPRNVGFGEALARRVAFSSVRVSRLQRVFQVERKSQKSYQKANKTTGFLKGTNPTINCENNDIRCMHVDFDEKMLKEKRSSRDDYRKMVGNLGYLQ